MPITPAEIFVPLGLIALWIGVNMFYAWKDVRKEKKRLKELSRPKAFKVSKEVERLLSLDDFENAISN